MSPRSFLLTDQQAEYLIAQSAGPDDVQRALIAETAALGPVAGMQIAPDQGALLTLLAHMVGARDAVEVGTFTGYSSICIARGLTEGGHLLCCDLSGEWTSIAKRYWEEAGVADRVTLQLAPALDTLRALAPDPQFDLAFIDADKPGYPAYWEELVPRVRPGGVLLVDNVLQGGRAFDASTTDDTALVIRAFNEQVAGDERVESVILPVADGLTLARRC